MNVAHDAAQLETVPRAVAIGTFDGVHLGHRAVVRAAVDAGLCSTVVTFEPHPRLVLGGNVELLATLQRRLELLAECGVDDVLVVPFTRELASLEAEAFVRAHLLAIGTQVVVAGSGFRFGRGREGDLALLERLGIETRTVPLVEGISSTRIRSLVRAGDVAGAARLLGRPVEVEGQVVGGDHRGTGLGFPTANLATPANLVLPMDGIYTGATGDKRAAVSIGANPHFGSTERRVEAYLIDWTGDLYGERLVVQVWQWLRQSKAFATDAELSAQIAHDVEATRSATPPEL